MYLLNKIVGGLLNPLVVGLVMVVASGLCLWWNRRKTGFWGLGASIAWFWIWGTPMMYRWIGAPLEREWPVVKAEDAPTADAIVLLGGGMGANPRVYPYAEMSGAADRVWHSARLYKAGKAPIVIPTGCGERETSFPLLRDFGVPESAIIIEDKARNTEENAKFVEKLINNRVEHIERVGEKDVEACKPKVLLVTSAWHMRRSVLMCQKYAPSLEIIPAATDYEVLVRIGHTFELGDLWPSVDYLYGNAVMFKEWLGYWGYRLLRR